jgi:heterodisulfide reductase subunit B
MNAEVNQEPGNNKYGTRSNMPVVYYSRLLSGTYEKGAKQAGRDGKIIKAKKLEDIAGN